MKQKLILCGAMTLFILKHSTAQTSLGTFDPEIKAEVFMGGSASFNSGKFIKDHKAFHEINYADADISGKVKPIIFFDAGVQGRMVAGQEGLLSQLSVSIGMFYSKSGFNHVYSYSSDNTSLDITNKMDCFIMLILPLQWALLPKTGYLLWCFYLCFRGGLSSPEGVSYS